MGTSFGLVLQQTIIIIYEKKKKKEKMIKREEWKWTHASSELNNIFMCVNTIGKCVTVIIIDLIRLRYPIDEYLFVLFYNDLSYGIFVMAYIRYNTLSNNTVAHFVLETLQ